MEKLLSLVAVNTVTMSLLIICFLFITPRLSNKYHSKWIYYSWLLIVIGLIVPFRIQFNIILEHSVSDPVYVQDYYSGEEQDIYLTEGNETESVSIPWYQIAGVIWLSGLIIYVMFQSWRHFRFIKILLRWGEEDKNTYEYILLQKISWEMGISKTVRLLNNPCITSPMQIGFVKPVILLPCMNFTDQELSLILRHELIHYKRKDLWYKGLILIATAIHWFNPLVFVMGKAIKEQCEMSCDNEVVKGADAEKRLQYCETIIGMMQQQSKAETVFAANLSNGIRGLKKRIQSILDGRDKKTGAVIMCLTLIGILLTGANLVTVAEGRIITITTDIADTIEDEETSISTVFEYYYKETE